MTQDEILERRKTAFAMLAEASEMESNLVLSRKKAFAGTTPSTPQMLALAEQGHFIYQERRRRERYFPEALFGEPGWDILLHLFVATARGLSVSTGDACEASCAPESTALRWLGALKDDRLIEVLSDEADQRRRNLRLTAKGLEAMYDYITALDGKAGTGTNVEFPSPSQPKQKPEAASGKQPWTTPKLMSLTITQKRSKADQ